MVQRNILHEVEDNRLLIKINDIGLCLYLNHAAKAAVGLGVDYQEYIQDFLMLDPKMFHISDGTLTNEKDEHLNIGEGDYDIGFLMNCVNRSELGYVTLETPRTKLSSLEEDLTNYSKLI